MLLLALPAVAVATETPADEHTVFTELLSAHVREGKVSYPALCADPRLATYLSQLAKTDPATRQGHAAFALWINAYNAYTLDLICDNYPVASIKDLASYGVLAPVVGTTAWDREVAHVGGTTYTLNHIEHEIVRPTFKDFRAHFALVCAAKSCPKLRSEAYEGARLEQQLDDQGRAFFADDSKNRFDVPARKAHLSQILDWFAGDFGQGRSGVLAAIAPFTPDPVKTSLQADPTAWSVDYLDYDWKLNE